MAETAQDNNNFILLYNRDKSMDIKKFMERNYIYGITYQELFDLNKDFIWQQYTDEDKKAYKDRHKKWPSSANDLTVNDYLPAPCELKINPSKVTAEVAVISTNAQANVKDFYAFADEKIQQIYQNEGTKIGEFGSKRSPSCSVFGWFKSRYFVGKGTQNVVKTTTKNEGEFVVLSKHVISLTTSVTANGGSFSLRLPIIKGEGKIDDVYEMKEDEELRLVFGDKIGEMANVSKGEFAKEESDDEYFSKTSFQDVEANYFNWLISSNDLLFISFEGISDEWLVESEVASDVILGNNFDMIGLVDEVKVTKDAQSSQGYVEVTGRDLMKLLLDDGSFFFNNSTSSDPSQVFTNDQSYGKQGDIREADFVNNGYNNPINRIRGVSGQVDIFANHINMDISYILKGVISQLANVEIVPGSVFDSWGEDRTKYIELEPEKK